ncbi:hypothetical protein M0R45_000218 [Rubus argutus]|uniref:Glycoside hydrolase family 3 C-terminal domain-containing protein n=1 Tax=Rubus argutus TaxID=59490 RepID=A0AAW1VMD7_RUBAR
MGLFENPLADLSLVSQLGSKEHRELARGKAVRRSLVLLKNGESADKPVLPLPKKASKILVAGSHADNLGYQCGGWTIEWQGLSGNNLTQGTTILTGIKNTVDPETKVVYKENPTAEFVKSNDFSYAIVVVGEPPYAETFAWLPGTEGQGVADVLFGDYGFHRQAFSALGLKTVDQLPMNVGDPHYDPLFPFGFGLTTTPTKAN